MKLLFVLRVLGTLANNWPSRFSPTTVLYPAVSLFTTHPDGDANGSLVSAKNSRSTKGGGDVSRTSGEGFGCGEPLSKTRPLGGAWKNVVGRLSIMAPVLASTAML